MRWRLKPKRMSYSDYWRVNKSFISHEELTNALRSLRKVVGHLGIDRETVWTGIPVPREEERIELPLFVAQGAYPIPSEKMDVLVGLAVHEALHVRQDRQHAWGYLAQMFPRMEDKSDLRKIADAGEDIHVDGVALQMGLLGKYVQKSRAWWKKGSKKDFTLGFPNEEGLLGVWMDVVLDGIYPALPPDQMDEIRETVANMAPTNGADMGEMRPLLKALCAEDQLSLGYIYKILVSMPRDYMDPLHKLLLKTPEIIAGDPEERALCYREFWVDLEPTFAEWKAAIKLGELSEDRGQFEGSAEEVGEVEESAPRAITEAIMSGLSDESKDVTSRIENVLRTLGGESDRHLLYDTIFMEGTEPCKTAPHRKLVRRLKEVFRLQREEAARTHHGLPSGKVDARRLYRAYTNGMVFKQKEYFPENTQWKITLLLDASGSVLWHWDFIESVYTALVEALVEGNADLDVYAYKETEMICEVTRLFYDSGLYTILPSGTTPTGEALIATGLMMPQTGRRLLIHVTDGLWNTGVDTWYALEFLKRQQIDMVTLGCGGAKRAFELQYGKNFEVMDSIEDLPKALEALLRRKLLKGA
jgi:hypothetical protein